MKNKLRFFLLLLTLSLALACDVDNTTKAVCGDGEAQPGEECDGADVLGRTCIGQGFYGGDLACNELCELDYTACNAAGRCGDGVIQDAFQETCDSEALGGATCESLGFYGGTLVCAGDCTLNTASCEAAGRCGDGLIQGDHEQCDNLELGGATCVSIGQDFSGGNLKCDPDCAFDTTECTRLTDCGNGQLDEGEVCDGTISVSETCESLGYYGGTLSCNAGCQFDLSNCATYGYCGDSVLQISNEDCDQDKLNLMSCESFGYHGGTLACSDECVFDLSDCMQVGQCGDGLIQDTFEDCEGTNLNGFSCESLGYHGGNLNCTDLCQFDISSCETIGRCGDGVIQIPYETCDGVELDSETCETKGYYGGILTCNSSCQYDEAGCAVVGRCGDGVFQDLFEPCEGPAFGSSTCQNSGYDTGVLSCSEECNVLYNQCRHQFLDFSSGARHSCGRKFDGTLWCWGANYSTALPEKIGTSSNWLKVSAGYTYTCGIMQDGSLWCWDTSPVRVGSDSDWVSVTIANNDRCAIKTNGTLWCWGNDEMGELGFGNSSYTYVPNPQQVGTDSNWVEVKLSNANHACGRKSNGTIWCWGANTAGELGLGSTADKITTPAQVGTDTTWVQITVEWYNSCARKSNGTIWCWGDNHYGQLGFLGGGQRSPVQVGIGTNWIQIDIGGNHVCGRTTDGAIWCWGRNNFGQLGIGNQTNQFTPTRVGVDFDWAWVDAGGVNPDEGYTCARKTDSTMYCWGHNYYRQLALGYTGGFTTSP